MANQYRVFALKYRPKNFDEVVGQEHVSTTLKNAIESNRVAHAYLFSGPRGVGKTTVARILSKSLNCVHGPTVKPCDNCPNCNDIAISNSVDVLEIDGASNRGIDEIRELRENVKFTPASSKYKIYIIDEAHQITDAAFNALLKTLEEPPEHVVFILATTEPQKIPITILSRCQRYRFRFLSSKEIMSALQNILQKENFQVEDEALKHIVLASGGSMRDALSLLDQVISFVQDKVTVKHVQDLLGLLPQDMIYSMTDAIAKRDYSRILNIIKDINDQGYSITQFGKDLREHFRKLILTKVEKSILEVSQEEKDILDKQESLFSLEFLVRSGHILSKVLDEMRWSDQARLLFELSCLRIAQPYEGINDILKRLEKIQRELSLDGYNNVNHNVKNNDVSEKSSTLAQVTTQVNEIVDDIKNDIKNNKIKTNIENSISNKKEDISSDISNNNNIDILSQMNDSTLIQRWKDVISDLNAKSPIIKELVSNIKPLKIQGNNIILSVSGKFEETGIKRNKETIEKSIEKVFGKHFNISILIKPDLKPQVNNNINEVVVDNENLEVENSNVLYEVRDDLTEKKDVVPADINKILEKFPGKVKKKK